MSGCSIHHFKTIDRPFTDAERKEINSWSSRFSPTSHEVRYIYHYGSFKQNVDSVFPKYFDALLHVDNWGTTQLMFRFPRNLVDSKALMKFTIIRGETYLDFKRTSDYLIMDLCWHNEEGGGWIEEDDYMVDSITSLREEILQGDYRSLYLGWMMVQQQVPDWKDTDDDELDEEELTALKPSVPSNMNQLTSTQKELIRIFEIDQEEIKKVAGLSSTVSRTRIDYKKLIGLLSSKEKDDFLWQLATGQSRVDILLQQRLRALDTQQNRKESKSKIAVNNNHREIIKSQYSDVKDAYVEALTQSHDRKMKMLIPQKRQLWDLAKEYLEGNSPDRFSKAADILQTLKELAEYEGYQSFFDARVAHWSKPFWQQTDFFSLLKEKGILTTK